MIRQLPCHTLTVAALLLLGLALPAVAQQQAPQDLVPLKLAMTYTLPQPRFNIPTSPAITVAIDTAMGMDPNLGAFTYIETGTAHVGVDGQPLWLSGGVGALTASNGDAIFFSFGGTYVTPTAPYDRDFEGTFTITGGQGRYLGATGSGRVRHLRDPVKQMILNMTEGMISRPKP
jgi:hypothetical protein